MTGSSVTISRKSTDSILIILAISQVPLCFFLKSTGSMEPVEPVPTTALIIYNYIDLKSHTIKRVFVGCSFLLNT